MSGIMERMFDGSYRLLFDSSGMYIINDIIDLKEDRIHPHKSKRPIAAVRSALLSALIVSASF